MRGAVGKRLAATSWRFTMAGALKPTVTAYAPSTPLSLGVGTNTGYKFTLDGKPTLAKHGTLAAASTVATSLRRTIAGQAGTWFYVTSGTWKGYWLRESDAVSLPGGSVAADRAATRSSARRHGSASRRARTPATPSARPVP